MNKKCCIHYIITGKVQGVWFRASTQEYASSLGLTGWARNLPTGEVEVLACGDKDTLQQLYTWLQVGPPRAEVTGVTSEELPWKEIARFGVM